MKIVLDARLYGLENGGIGRYLINLIDELKELDQDNKYCLLLRRKHFNTLKLPDSWEGVLIDFGHYGVEEQLKLPTILKEERPDIVHFPHFNTPVLWSGKYIVTIHDMTMHRQGKSATNLPLPLYYLKRIPYKYVFRKAVVKSSKIITPTRVVKDRLVGYFGVDKKKIVQIYEGVEDKYFKKVKAKGVLDKFGIGERYFIYTGNAYPHKNLKRAIEAIALVNKKKKEKVLLAIAGSRDIFKKRLISTVEELEARKYVRFLGFVPDEELAVLYKKSAGFVYPSLSEGFGLQGLEVMAAGGLVVASNIPAFKEVYNKHAIYFNPYDFSSIFRAMKDVLDMDVDKRKNIIKKGQTFVKRYSWRKMAEQTLEVYKKVHSN